MDPKRFWKQVRKTEGCWFWNGTTRNGYGRLTIEGVTLTAHRLSYELFNGPVPEGLKVLHRCDNPGCVRPDHLFLGTQLENIADCVRKGRHRNPVLHGSSNPMSKLTEDQVKALREFPPRRAEKAAIAAHLGVTHRALNKILEGTRWRGPEDGPVIVRETLISEEQETRPTTDVEVPTVPEEE